MILIPLVVGLLSVGKLQKNASANAGWAVAKLFDGGEGTKTVSSAAGSSLGTAAAAWGGAEIGGELGTFLGAGVGAL